MDSLELAADALRDTFPGCENAPLAVALVRLLAHGQPVSTGTLADAARRPEHEVAAQLARWPNVERDADGAVAAFSGLTLRSTLHSFVVVGRHLHTWCAWDTLFLPALLNMTAHIRSTCPMTGCEVELVVGPAGVERAEPAPLHVSFPPVATTDTDNITSSFCCHVHFLAGDDAAHAWQNAHPDGEVRALETAYALGRRAVEPLAAAASAGTGCC